MSTPTVRRFLLSGAIVAVTTLAIPVGIAGSATAAPSLSNKAAQGPATPNPSPNDPADGSGNNPGNGNGGGTGGGTGNGNGGNGGGGQGGNGPGNGNGGGNGGGGQGNGGNGNAGNGNAGDNGNAAAAAAAAAQAAKDAAAKAQQTAKRKADAQAQAKADQAAQQAADKAAQQAADAAAKQQAKLVAAQLEAQQKAQVQAAKLAARRAAAAQRAITTWKNRGRPNKLVIVRTTSIDSVSKGELVQSVARNGRTVSMSTLDASIPASWMSFDGATARLGAAVVMTPYTLLDVEGVQALQLVGGNDAADAAFLYTGSGRIQTRGVTISSVDAATGQPVGPGAAGRPFIRVSDQGRLDTVDTTITDLGTRPTGDLPGTAAISFGAGSTGSLTGTSFQRNSTGLMLAGSQSVKLQDVTVANSTADGMVLRSDLGTIFSGVKAEHNGDNGVLVTGNPSNRAITGISSTGNHSYGVSLTGQKNIEVSDLTLNGDLAGGLELNRISDSKVHNVTTTDEPNGVFLHVNSTNVVLDSITVTGGRTGVVAEKTTKGLHVTGGTIDGAHVAGMEIGGHDTTLDGLTVKNSRTAVRVERGAGGIAASKVQLIGGEDGLVTSGGTTGVVVTDLTTDGVGNDAIRNLSPGMQITGGQIRGGNTGIDLQAGTTVTGLQVGLTSTGIRARATDPIMLDNVTVDAVSVGVEAQPGGTVTLRRSSVHALEAVRGTIVLDTSDDLSLPPLNLLGAIGLPLIVLAIVLEALHLLRQRRFGPTRRAMPPAIPVGAG